MSGLLIIYSSTDGHTAKICKRITNYLDRENTTKIASIEEAMKFNLSKFDKIIIAYLYPVERTR